MNFEFYTDALQDVPKLSVDGIVPNSIHFSHWEGNETPAEVKADTSTEIALKLAASPNRSRLTKGIQLVTNNHFDTDGVLSVWSVLNPEKALGFRDLLVDAAEAGDFSENSSPQGVRISLAIQGTDGAIPNEPSGSPLAQLLAGRSVTDEAQSYGLILPEVERLLGNPDAYEALWREGWVRISKAIESFETGQSRVEEVIDSRLSIVTLSADIYSASGFNPTKHAAPYTAISYVARGELYLIGTPANDGWFYRIDYPYYSWAETVVRPRIVRRDLKNVFVTLNEREKSSAGSWKSDNRELTAAGKFVADDGQLAVSKLEPDEVASAINDAQVRKAAYP